MTTGLCGRSRSRSRSRRRTWTQSKTRSRCQCREFGAGVGVSRSRSQRREFRVGVGGKSLKSDYHLYPTPQPFKIRQTSRHEWIKKQRWQTARSLQAEKRVINTNLGRINERGPAREMCWAKTLLGGWQKKASFVSRFRKWIRTETFLKQFSRAKNYFFLCKDPLIVNNLT